MKDGKSLGTRIKEMRHNAGLPQVDLARLIGVSKQTLYKYENDIITNIPSDKIEALAHILNTTPAYLMGWDEELDPETLKQAEYFSSNNMLALFENMGFERYHLIDTYDKLPSDGKDKMLDYNEYLISSYGIKDKLLTKEEMEVKSLDGMNFYESDLATPEDIARAKALKKSIAKKERLQ